MPLTYVDRDGLGGVKGTDNMLTWSASERVGNPLKPYATKLQALANALPGDEIRVRAAVSATPYAKETFTGFKPSSNITIRGETGETPTTLGWNIDNCKNLIFKSFDCVDSMVLTSVDSIMHDTVIGRNQTAAAGTRAGNFLMKTVNNCLWNNCTLTWRATLTGLSGDVVPFNFAYQGGGTSDQSNNIIQNSAVDNWPGDLIHPPGSARQIGWKLLNNKLSRSNAITNTAGARSHADVLQVQGESLNWLISGNIIYEGVGRILIMPYQDGNGQSTGVGAHTGLRVINNIWFNTTDFSLELYNCPGPEIINNTFYSTFTANSGRGVILYSKQAETQSGNNTPLANYTQNVRLKNNFLNGLEVNSLAARPITFTADSGLNLPISAAAYAAGVPATLKSADLTAGLPTFTDPTSSAATLRPPNLRYSGGGSRGVNEGSLISDPTQMLGVPTTDQDGLSRNGTRVDVGAYEFGGTIPGGTPPVAALSLSTQQATVGQSVTMNASGTVGTVTHYYFTKDNFATETDNGTTATFSFTPTTPGTYQCAVRAQGAGGSTTSSIIALTVTAVGGADTPRTIADQVFRIVNNSSLTGSTKVWTNASNALGTTGGDVATNGLNFGVGSGISSGLLFQNADFSAIPDNAVITGLTLEMFYKTSVVNTIVDYMIQLYSGLTSSLIGDNRADTVTPWSTSYSTKVIGNSTDKWGSNLTPALLKNSASGVLIAAQNESNTSATAAIDWVTLTVDFIEPGVDPGPVDPPPDPPPPTGIAVPFGPLLPNASSDGGLIAPSAVPWTSPESAIDEDSLTTSVRLTASGSRQSQPLVLSQFNFPIPDDATIRGIEVTVNGRQALNSVGAADLLVSLAKNGVAIGDNKAKAGVWSSSSTNRLYGSDTDTWNLDPLDRTPARISSGSFGVLVSVQNTSTSIDADIFVGHVLVTVYVSVPSLPASPQPVLLVTPNPAQTSDLITFDFSNSSGIITKYELSLDGGDTFSDVNGVHRLTNVNRTPLGVGTHEAVLRVTGPNGTPVVSGIVTIIVEAPPVEEFDPLPETDWFAYLPGLESVFYISHPRLVSLGTGSGQLRLHDMTQLERYQVDSIDGLFDTPNLRGARQAKSDDHGTTRGRQKLDEKVIAFNGKIIAMSFKRMREMQRALSLLAFSAEDNLMGEDRKDLISANSAWAEPPTITISPVDTYVNQNWGDKVWANWISNPNFEELSDWTREGEDASTFAQTSSSIFSLDSETSTAFGDTCLHVVKTVSVGETWRLTPTTALPVTHRASFSLSALFKISSVSGSNVALELRWLDAARRPLETTTSSTLTSVITARLALDDVFVPAGAHYLSLAIRVTGTGSINFFVTNVMLSDRPVSAFVGPGMPGTVEKFSPVVGKFSIGPRRHNLVRNASGEGNLPPTSSNATVIPTRIGGPFDKRFALENAIGIELLEQDSIQSSGYPSLVLTSINAGNMNVSGGHSPAREGATYSASGYFSATTQTRAAFIRINFRGAAGVLISSFNSPVAIEQEDNERVYFEAVAPAGTYLVDFNWVIVGCTDNESHIVSGRCASVGSHEYFSDGSTPGWQYTGTTFYSPSEEVAPEAYVLEQLDIDVKQAEKQETRDRRRSFLLTCKARDPRIYRKRSSKLELIAGIGTTPYVIERAPGTYSAVEISSGDAGAISNKDGYTTMAAAVPATGAQTSWNMIRVPNEGAQGLSTFAQVEGQFKRIPLEFRLSSSSGIALALVANRSTGDHVEVRIEPNGNVKIFGMKGGSGFNNIAWFAPTVKVPLPYGARFWLRAWITAVSGQYVYNEQFFLRNPGDGGEVIQERTVNLSSIAPASYASVFTNTTSEKGWGMLQSRFDSTAHPDHTGGATFADDVPPGFYEIPRVYSYEQGIISSEVTMVDTDSIHVLGDVDTPPTIQFNGPVSYPTIEIPYSGLVITLKTRLQMGDYVIMNPDGSLEGLISGSQAGAITVDDSLFTLDSRMNKILPGRQTVNFRGYGVESNSSRITLTWRPAYQ